MISFSKLCSHEKVLTRLFDVKTSLMMFDIGACEGLSSARYLELFPNSEIYAFEPVPKNHEKILDNKESYQLKNLNVYKLGLSSKKGNALFYLSSKSSEGSSSGIEGDYGNKSSSLLKPDKHNDIHPDIKFDNTIEIELETLDSFCENLGISKIDFIHMDVQGAELEVLKGGVNMLPNISGVWLEVERVSLYEGQPLKDEIESFFRKNGFTCIISDLNHISGDQLWVKKSFVWQVNMFDKLFLFRVKTASYIKTFISTLIGGLRYKMRLRTRFLNLFRQFQTIKNASG